MATPLKKDLNLSKRFKPITKVVVIGLGTTAGLDALIEIIDIFGVDVTSAIDFQEVCREFWTKFMYTAAGIYLGKNV